MLLHRLRMHLSRETGPIRRKVTSLTDAYRIDEVFVQMVDDSGLAHTQIPIIRSIVSLAMELDLLVIAEGVETLEEIERLQQLNCQFAQGFAFGAAMTAQDFTKRLAAQLGR